MSRKASLAGSASLAAVILALASQGAVAQYAPGDFHNHTTCTDGTGNVDFLVNPSVNRLGLAFFMQTDHGGNGNRDCRFTDLDYSVGSNPGTTANPNVNTDGPQFGAPQDGANPKDGALWVDTIGVANLLGDATTSSIGVVTQASGQQTATSVRAMWRWQNIQQFEYPLVRRAGKANPQAIVIAGLETNNPGHEHTDVTILNGQTSPRIAALGNATALGQWEYRFDRSDTDLSGGRVITPTGLDNGANTGTTPNSLTGPTIAAGSAGWNAGAFGKGSGIQTFNGSGSTAATQAATAISVTNTAALGFANGGYGGHYKSTRGVVQLQQNFPLTSFYVPAHLERAGAFNTLGSNGFNIEHLRDFNNAGPTVAVGFESQPGHQAAYFRGEYNNCGLPAGTNGRGLTCGSSGVTGSVDPGASARRSSGGGFTYGGTGGYAAVIGGVWDNLLAEGRNWWFFGSSDYHNRGQYNQAENWRQKASSDADFQPGEYQKVYVPKANTVSAQRVVDAIRAGNAYSVEGDLIGSDLQVTASGGGQTATMGQTLVVPAGTDVTVTITGTLPSAVNNSPYSFPNPILKSASLPDQPLNAPKLDHVDFIGGAVTGIIPRNTSGAQDNWAVAPTNPAYTQPQVPGFIVNPANATEVTTALNAAAVAAPSNTAASLLVTRDTSTVARGQRFTVTYTISNVQGPRFIRARGTNLPAGIANATDGSGNPSRDDQKIKIRCTDAACPSHTALPAIPAQNAGLNTGDKAVISDVLAWSDLWFYTNPIFIRTTNDAPLRAEVNAALAKKLAGG